MRKVIIISIVVLVLAVIVVMIIRKQAKKRAEVKAFGGMDMDEFKRNIQLAWKDRYFEKTTEALKLPEPWAETWRAQIDNAILGTGKTLDQAILETVQFAWAKDNPKANDNPWSAGWLREIYVKKTLGIDPIPPEVLKVVNEI